MSDSPGMKENAGERRAMPLDLKSSPLEGVHLVEAGAGTGKTYALTALFARLILEKGLTVEEILVVTFTVAAARELRDRIRRKLRETLDALTGREGDGFARDLPGGLDPAEAVPRLEEALRDFDLASIFTIHGFCMLMLREQAFESGATFDTELLADDSEMRAEILDDFWRTRFYPVDPEIFRYAQKSCKMKQLRELLAKGTAQPQVSIIPEPASFELPSLEPARTMFKALREEWRAARGEILQALSSPALDGRKYKPERLAADMDAFLSGTKVLTLFDGFEKFTPECMSDSVKKNGKCPLHPFFEKCGELAAEIAGLRASLDRVILSLKGEMFTYFRSEFRRRKEGLNVQSYDDLLVRMKSALEGEHGKALAAAIRRRYRAALIDEFQDTDPVQYAIFSGIFGSGSLYLIGDPKQAIYGFRGADLFTYLQASSEIENTHTLLTNRRSEPALINAVNAVFGKAANPFVFKEIEFREALSEPREELEPLTFSGEPEPPFHIWILEGDQGDQGGTIPKGKARKIISRQVALEIKRLVGLGRAGMARLGSKPLREADIAVLVRKHREARLIQKTLRELGIISVIYSEADLFASDEAVGLVRVLRAIAEPSSEKAFRAALATDLIGMTAEVLEGLIADDLRREERQACFLSLRETWERSGFMAMYRRLLTEENVRERLVAWPDGERRITNYLHLGEVLHREETESKRGPASLVDWLALKQTEEARQTPEERQVRLESDAEAVKVITIHMSKGLEFPIVFCPFNWDGRMETKEGLLYHEKKDVWKLNLALSSPGPEVEGLARMEMLAESVRLLYVSLTRAKNRCYLVWGNMNESCTSAPAYILHPMEGTPESIVERLRAHVEDLPAGELRSAAEAVRVASKGSVSVSSIPLAAVPDLGPAAAGAEAGALREFNSPLERDWLVSSFSSLAGSPLKLVRPSTPEMPDHDGASEDDPDIKASHPGDRTGITGFPRGAAAGNFFHKLFEGMDFSDQGGIEGYALRKLAEHGYGPEWADPVSTMVRNVLAADLDGKGLKLGNLDASRRLSELGFYFPLNRIDPVSLGRFFGKPAGGKRTIPAFGAGLPEWLGSLEFAPCRGYMRGFIDLVFTAKERWYLVDWKSNFLGHAPGDYSAAKLARSMAEHLYFLQYHLYCLALHLYLRKRLPGYSYEKHFGGVFYIYLRGFGSAGSSAIFRDRPEEGLIDELARGLLRVDENGIKNA